ncbi:MAG: HU family DNA-binding protein [Bacteroidaceae bacterium]|nr:HU family DNA-binding protein [Bacteroidaceae bacterium]
MDAKLNHSDFSALLSKQLDISASKAEQFTKAFFDILIEGLESDGIVKINGLGTFKMIDVASRGSVNVNTGEKIEIKGHRKLTFIPADTLKDKINQPFAMFEPVEVDDDYVDDSDETQPVEPSSDEQTAESVLAEPSSDEQTAESVLAEPSSDEQTVEPVLVEPSSDEQTAEPVLAEPSSDEQTAEPVLLEPSSDEQTAEPVLAEPSSDEQTAEPVETTKSKKGHIVISTLFIINMIITFSIIIAVVIIFYSQFSSNEKIDESNNIVPELIAKDTLEKTVLSDTVDKQPEVLEEFVMVEAMNNLTLAQITIKDTAIYRIKGTKTVHRVGLDETLTKISLLYFEDKRFWPYIVQYNKIKNYNSLEIGTELLIPNLVPRK